MTRKNTCKNEDDYLNLNEIFFIKQAKSDIFITQDKKQKMLCFLYWSNHENIIQLLAFKIFLSLINN